MVRDTALQIAEHKGPSARGTRVIRHTTEVSIHAGGKVYKPTWDASTWSRRGKTILRSIASPAHLTEVQLNQWVRDSSQ